ncbi:MAG: glycine cleavage system protein GcvH [Limnochordaceae bacterium]|nr:glycine cleavage system protein GcvH [Limnochordaceae bacterium]
MYPEHLKYTKEHEWVAVDGRKAKVGVTFYAQKELGDVVFVELPKKGAAVEQGKRMAVIESVKAVSDVYAPVSGTVAEVNEALADEPERVNKDPYGDGWICVVEVARPEELGQLLSAADYKALIGAQ